MWEYCSFRWRPPAAHASTFTTLYKFTDGADGGEALGGVVEDTRGTIYGETYRGGGVSCSTKQQPSIGCGTIYCCSHAIGFKVLATFDGTNGAHGNLALTLRGNTLYGATANGGADDDGVVFSIDTDDTGFTLLHQFSGVDGSRPIGSLVVTPGGTLYGITQTG